VPDHVPRANTGISCILPNGIPKQRRDGGEDILRDDRSIRKGYTTLEGNIGVCE